MTLQSRIGHCSHSAHGDYACEKLFVQDCVAAVPFWKRLNFGFSCDYELIAESSLSTTGALSPLLTRVDHASTIA
jgi:hypothetical protein